MSGFDLSVSRRRIAPSLLAADFGNLQRVLPAVEKAGTEILHLDVMDGHFVPNISFGPPVIQAIRPHTKLFFDTHLMIQEPQRYAEAFANAGSDHITFHIEVVDRPEETVKHIRDQGVTVGVSLNPTTPVNDIESIIDSVDMVLIMSVWPGFGGQTFIPDVLPKVRAVRKRLADHQRLEIDGGIDIHTIEEAAAAGADTFVAGTAVFRQKDPGAAAKELRRLAEGAAVPGTERQP